VKESTIHNLFPIPIYMNNIDRPFTKQELKFGQGETYSNKLGFGSNPLFKLPKEK